MRKIVGVFLLIAVVAIMSLGGCTSGDTTSLCADIATAKTSGFRFAASPNTTVRVITSPNAEKLCKADIGIKLRYENDDLSRNQAPQNIKVEFAVEDDSGEPATIFDVGDPEFTTLYGRRYVQWGIQVSAAERQEPVNYYIRIGTDALGDRAVLADAVIRYTVYEAPKGLLY